MTRLQSSAPPQRRSSTARLHADLFREAAAVVRAELAAPLTVDYAAARVYASPRQLRRAFSEVAGTPFGAYVREMRIARAVELLEATDLPIQEIAESVGYRQPSQFTKAFKRVTGTTPTRLRIPGRG